MVSFMSGMPRVKVNQGRVNRNKFITGFVDQHFKSKAEAIRKSEADRKFNQDQELIEVKKQELEERNRMLDLQLAQTNRANLHKDLQLKQDAKQLKIKL